MGFHGSEIKTPFLDSLNAAGVELRHYYGVSCRPGPCLPLPPPPSRLLGQGLGLGAGGSGSASADPAAPAQHMICTPSRSAVMSGRYAFHTGMQHSFWGTGQDGGLPLRFATMADHLKGPPQPLALALPALLR